MLFKISLIFLILNVLISITAIILNCIAMDMIVNVDEEKEDLLEEIEEKNYEIKELNKKLDDKQTECEELMQEVNPYVRYGISESDFH